MEQAGVVRGRLALVGRVVLGGAVALASYGGPPAASLFNPSAQPAGSGSVETMSRNGTVVYWVVSEGGVLVAVGGLAALACGAAVVAARWWRWPLYVSALAAWLMFGMWPALPVASYYAAVSRGRHTDLAAYGAAAGIAVVLPGLVRTSAGRAVGPADLGYPIVALVLLVGLPIALGLLVRARRDVRGGVRERDRAREGERAARLDQARAEERARIAREMHDVLAHRVSLMVVQAGALEVKAEDEATATTAALIRTTGRQALTDLRQVLGVLRSPDGPPSPQPWPDDLDTLLEQSRLAGVSVVRHDEGDARPLPSPVRRAVYRVVQEALTNVHKHAGDAATRVAFRYGPDDVEIEVRNAPGEAGAGLPGSGLGLAGLRERVELLGGRFSSGPSADGGFAVRARIPLEAPWLEAQ